MKKVLTIIGLLVIAIFIYSNAELFTLVWKSDLDSVIGILKENLLLTFIVTFVLMFVQNSFTIIPLILLLTINVTIFGFIYGYLWSWFTSVVASGFIFYAVRNWFQELLLKKIGEKWQETVVEHGFMYVFTGRIFPLIPTSLINLAAGVSTVTFKDFLLATALGNLIYFFFLSLIPYGLLSVEMNQYTLVALALLTLLFFIIYKRAKKKKKLTFFRKNR
ncbi:TVP38/TMEM64 family protein [Peribacillus simplex]|uniref:TVP38/TMEM64 family membrane protein n=1 Tax=Peribacillus simplex TaxID=1478 RepID=A0A8B5XXT5_9BACI|nr:VTT domain-containing protein [Peribacillus simplex]MEC1397084.1 VTT domain-containing protein [Peribacillus simplex]MED3908447.1 VTT domain-containing protein [Peribacillus simplex]MED3986899.1 VTT domain-containing protein [Peribacillus simplex]MED4095734.1 VTT domain-containing protein [Peribacillus simplex]TVX79971.1 TVP38/TMEM64 family protein [Peribacillus simplex]